MAGQTRTKRCNSRVISPSDRDLFPVPFPSGPFTARHSFENRRIEGTALSRKWGGGAGQGVCNARVSHTVVCKRETGSGCRFIGDDCDYRESGGLSPFFFSRNRFSRHSNATCSDTGFPHFSLRFKLRSTYQPNLYLDLVFDFCEFEILFRENAGGITLRLFERMYREKKE